MNKDILIKKHLRQIDNCGGELAGEMCADITIEYMGRFADFVGSYFEQQLNGKWSCFNEGFATENGFHIDDDLTTPELLEMYINSLP